METSIKLTIMAIFIILTAFFVVSEFAIVKVRKSSMEARAHAGDQKALHALTLIDNLDYYLSACQLGITMTALGLGWLGEPTLEALLHPLLESINLSSGPSHAISFAAAFVIITFLHVVLGELVPKTLATQKAESVALALARPLILYSKLMYPFICLLNRSANFLVRILGFQTVKQSGEVHSEEELRHILTESYQKGEINRSEYEYVDRIFEFDNRTANEIMVPRTDISVIDIEDPIHESLNYLKSERFTRYPVIQGNKDQIIGFLHIKELFKENWDQLESLQPLIHPVIKVFENIPIHDLLIMMQKENTHLVVLTDEYGGTAGIVTVEDIIEEIVGDIRDEFDVEEEQDITVKGDGTYLVDGKTSITDINNYFDIELENEEVDTISGWILKYHIEAMEGATVTEGDYKFKISEPIDGQIRKVKVWKEN